jgi:peptide-methionine (S)-S-oxide reductase
MKLAQTLIAAALIAGPASAAPKTETAVLAGGCFWGMESVFEHVKGVTNVVSGYAGGSPHDANYDAVSSEGTGHAEAVKITYDPAKITYGELLRVLFTTIDPTTKDRQGPDAGHQYRSAIFYENDDQKKVAEAYIKQLNDAKVFDHPIVTTLEPLKLDQFYKAEDYHQNFVACHLNHPYIRQEALPKVQKVREKFKDEVKPAATEK